MVRYLAACEVVVEPYPDGISSRRSSTMAPLGAGLPVDLQRRREHGTRLA